MSWSLFKSRCNVLTGNPHVTVELFAQTIASAYSDCMSMHFDSMTAGGVLVNNVPKMPALQQQIMSICNANLQSGADVDFLAQIGPAFVNYWVALSIVGPTGNVIVTSPGTWSNLKVPPNQNFQIILNNLMIACRTHIMTVVGTYTSTVVPGVVSPWSGALFQSLP